MNGSAIDRGLFVCTQYKTIEETEKKGNNYSTETICMPPLNSPSVIKIGQEGYFKRKSANFSLLDKNGVVRRGMIIKKGDVLVGKIVTKNTKNCIEVRTDCSRIIQEDEEGIVDRVFTHITPNGYRLIKVVVRNEKIPEIGDKFACYSPDHEVLTDKGWIFVNEITKEHVLACMVDKTKLEYHKPTEIQSYNYKGKMYNVNSSKISLCVTPNHRMYTGNCHRQSYNIQNAEQIYGKMRSYKNNIEQWNPPSELKTFTLPAYGNLPALELDLEAWCLFFGIWMAEGCYHISSGGIYISANKQRVKNMLDKVCNILKFNLGKHMEKGEKNKWWLGDKQIGSYFKPLSVGAINKSLPEWCYSLDMYHSQKLIEGMVLGDGCYMGGTTTVRYYTSSIKLRDDFQRLCLHAGWGCNYYLKSPKGTKSMCLGREITSNADYWTLTICKTQTKPLVNKYIKQGKQLDSWNEYDGKVYCCTVPTKDGLIFVRRNGKSVWCGNSRAAQKGTVGMIYRQEDMPFTNSGMVPDIIINPACIPSRMTVNQLIETALGKVSAVDGTYGDASPFTKNSINVADTIAEKLGKLGYERHGWERMYSGFTGEMLKAKVYCFEKGTQVLMGNACNKEIENITIGDYVMGADTYPKKVIALPRGHGNMYHIKPVFNTRSDSKYNIVVIEELGYVVSEHHHLILYTNYNKWKGRPSERNKAWVVRYPTLLYDDKLGFEKISLQERSFCWDEKYPSKPVYTQKVAYKLVKEHRKRMEDFGCTVNLYHRKNLNSYSIWLRKIPQDLKVEFKSFSYKYGEKSNRYKYSCEKDANDDAVVFYKSINDDIEWKITVEDYLKYKSMYKTDELRLSWSSKPLNNFSSQSSINIAKIIDICYEKAGKSSLSNRIDPDLVGWYIGLWIGDGRDNTILVDYLQTEIVDRCRHIAESIGCSISIDTFREGEPKEHYHVHFPENNVLEYILKELGIYQKQISDSIISGLMNQSIQFRAKIIEGIIDADGNLPSSDIKLKRYYTVSHSPHIRTNCILMIRALARSLGIKATIRQTKTKSGNDIQTICLSGQHLSYITPVVKDKQMSKKHFDTPFKNTHKIQFEIIPKEPNDFYGITLEGTDSKFLLSDMNIVSNCGPTYYQRLKHMVSNKMHCLTLDHEVLTITGWKYFNELTLQDKIATLVNGELEYVHPTHLHSYPKYKGEMYHIENQGIDLLATSKHRMYVSKPFGRKRIWQDYELIEAKQLLYKTVRYKKNARWLKKAYTVTLPAVTKTITIHIDKKIPELVINDMDSFITFFGIWYAEGWASGTDTCGRIQLAVNKQRVKDALYPALDKLGYKYTVAPDDKLTLVDYQLYRFMKPLSVGAPQKKFPSWVFELNLEQSRLLINSMILGDGSIGKNGCKMYYSSSKVLIDQFQQLCLHSGWASNITIHIPIGVVNHIKGRPVVNTHNILRASVITERVMPSVNLGTNKTVQKEYITTMECPVFCVSVPSEIFYVRRNGKPVWTGNSRARGRITMLTRQPLEGYVTTLIFTWQPFKNDLKFEFLIIIKWN
jgi:hypothetical protein